MILKIKATNIKLSPEVLDYISKKFNDLDKLFGSTDPDLVIVEFEAGTTTDHHRKGKIHKAEANISVGGKLIRACEVGESVFSAIDLVKDEIVAQIRKFKQRKQNRKS